MKRSNLLLLLLSSIFLMGIFVTDRILALEYRKIDLHDPYKNFETIHIKPFRSLKINGGNSYVINIRQGEQYGIRLLHSRKSFFTMQQVSDTLSISFNVSNQTYQQPGQCTTGLIIFVPKLDYLQLSGTNNEIGPLLQDSLVISQNGKTNTRLKELQLNYLNLTGSGYSYYDLQLKNNAERFAVEMKEHAAINLQDIHFAEFTPVLQDSAAIVMYNNSLKNVIGH